MTDDDKDGERIAKRLARAGLCSRRDAERWILEGRVAVNGQVLTTPAFVVREADDIVVNGKPVPKAEPTRLWRYHKPSGLVTSARDEKGRRTVFDSLPPDMPRVVSVGRLDLTSEGLLLLTNDGELARHLELPATGWTRRYRARAFGDVNEAQLARLANGIEIEGVRYGPIEAVLERRQGANAWITVGLKEGKNREVRKVLEHMGLQVNRLIRIAYGPFQLGKLNENAVEEVPKRVVQEQLGAFLGIEAPKPKLAPAAPRKSTTAPTYTRPRHLPERSDERAPARSSTKRAPARSDDRQPAPTRSGPRPTRSDDRGYAPRGDGPKRAPSRGDDRGPAPARGGPKRASTRSDERGHAPRADGPKRAPSRGDEGGHAPRGDGPKRASTRSDERGHTPRGDSPKRAPSRGHDRGHAPRGDGPKRAPSRGDDRGPAPVRSGPKRAPTRGDDRGPAPGRDGPKHAPARGDDRSPAPARSGPKRAPARSGDDRPTAPGRNFPKRDRTPGRSNGPKAGPARGGSGGRKNTR